MTIAVVLGLSLSSFADPYGGGVFQRGERHEGAVNMRPSNAHTPMLPIHGQDTNQSAPLGSGIFVLSALCAAYFIGKHCKWQKNNHEN